MAINIIEPLDWDSVFFDYPVGKIVLSDDEKLNLEKFIHESHLYKIVYIFSPMLVSIDKAILVDRKVVLCKSLDKKKRYVDKHRYSEFYNHVNHEYKQLEDLAIESGKYSRFKTDLNFKNNEFESLYKKWIHDSVLKINALEILVIIETDQIVGLITIGKKTEKRAEIGLLAVRPDQQGKGIGSKFLNDAETYAINAGFKSIQVVTQMDNENAMKLYIKNGYRIETITNIYHYWNL